MACKKRVKRELGLLTLSEQILELIFQLAGRKSIVALSCVCKKYRQELENYVFNSIKTIWYEFQGADFLQFLKNKSRHVRQVRIVDCYSYGEWQIDMFELILNQLPHLQSIKINSYNSSNWCKYRHNQTIKCFEIYCDISHRETELLHSNPNPKNIRRLYTPTNIPKIFNLNHLKNFSHLTQLRLTGFHFDWDEKEPVSCIHLRFLWLKDCTWQYPFSLVRFNEYNSLLCLQLDYTAESVLFTYSERFNKFLREPLQLQSNLENLSINFAADSNQRLSMTQLETFMSQERFPKLNQLALMGWGLDDKTMKAYLEKIDLGSVHPMKVVLGPGRVYNVG